MAGKSVVMLLALERKNRFSGRHRSFCQWTARCKKCRRAIGSTSAAVLVAEISALDCNCPISADISATRTVALVLSIARKRFSQRAVHCRIIVQRAIEKCNGRSETGVLVCVLWPGARRGPKGTKARPSYIALFLSNGGKIDVLGRLPHARHVR